MVEYKLDGEGTPCEYKTPFKRNTTWHRVSTTPGGQPLHQGLHSQGPEQVQCQSISQQIEISIPRSTSFDRKLPNISRYSHNFSFYSLLSILTHCTVFKNLPSFCVVRGLVVVIECVCWGVGVEASKRRKLQPLKGRMRAFIV